MPGVSVKTSSSAGLVDVDVNVTQIGVAPFYYDLSLAIQCPGMSKKILDGVEALIDKGSSKVFGFTRIPATKECLDALSLSLESSYAYSGRPIKFAQDDGAVSFSLPLPGSGEATAPITAPVRSPEKAPVGVPVQLPVKAPVATPVKPPVKAPVATPVQPPLKGPAPAPVKPKTPCKYKLKILCS